MIIPKYYEDLKTLHVNTMPNRAYYIPASGRMDNPTGEREESDRFVPLSGEWKFRYFDSIYDVREEFYAGRAKVHVEFDGEPYDGSVVNMGVKNADGSVCYIIGILKDIRNKLGKQPGDMVSVTAAPKEY